MTDIHVCVITHEYRLISSCDNVWYDWHSFMCGMTDMFMCDHVWHDSHSFMWDVTDIVRSCIHVWYDWDSCVIMCDMTDIHSCVMWLIFMCDYVWHDWHSCMCDMTDIFMCDYVWHDWHSFMCDVTNIHVCSCVLWLTFYRWYDGYSRVIMCDMTNKHIGLHTHFCRSSTFPHAHGWAVFCMCLLSVSFVCVFCVSLLYESSECVFCVCLLCVSVIPGEGFVFLIHIFDFFSMGFLCAAIAAPLHTRTGGLSFVCVFGVCLLSCMRGLWGGYNW